MFRQLAIMCNSSDDITFNSLEEAKCYVLKQAQRLNQSSRYIVELLNVIDSVHSLDELDTYMNCRSRSALQIGAHFLKTMPLNKKLDTNLVTPETYVQRFNAKELRILPELFIENAKQKDTVHILSAPCSIGLEVLTLAALFENSVPEKNYTITGVDNKEEFLADIRSGHVPLLNVTWQPEHIKAVTEITDESLRVKEATLKRLRFIVCDLLHETLKDPYDFIFCRNFLGFFKPDIQTQILQQLMQHQKAGTILCLDEYILSHPNGSAVQEVVREASMTPLCSSTATILRL